MEMVLPVYEHATSTIFYNACVVAAIEAILVLLPIGYCVVALEIGAGTGGTASSVLPALKDSCERYIFTDVSDVFLRQAQLHSCSQMQAQCILYNGEEQGKQP